MFGSSIKEVLEDNSMDIYMIMEALDTQKIHWYLKRKGSNKLTNACYAVRNRIAIIIFGSLLLEII